MAESSTSMPDHLRRRIADDLEPVRPLKAPWQRALLTLPVLALAVAMLLVYLKLRDTGELGMLLAWIPVAIQLLIAFALLVVALREIIPGWRASRAVVMGTFLLGFGLHVVVNYLIYLRSPTAAEGSSFAAWLGCIRTETLIGVPILVAVAWLAARALPQRTILAGFLVGIGAGLAADASWRLFCPVSTPSHVLLAHTGGILALGLTGLLLGALWTLYWRRESSLDT